MGSASSSRKGATKEVDAAGAEADSAMTQPSASDASAGGVQDPSNPQLAASFPLLREPEEALSQEHDEGGELDGKGEDGDVVVEDLKRHMLQLKHEHREMEEGRLRLQVQQRPMPVADIAPPIPPSPITGTKQRPKSLNPKPKAARRMSMVAPKDLEALPPFILVNVAQIIIRPREFVRFASSSGGNVDNMTWVEAALVQPSATNISRPAHSVAGDCMHVTAGSDISYRATHVLTLPMTPGDWDKALSETPSVALRIYLIHGPPNSDELSAKQQQRIRAAQSVIGAADLPLSISLLSRHAQPPPLDSLADAEDGGSIDHVLANIQECSYTFRAPRLEGDAADSRAVANLVGKVCAWGWHWHAALAKFSLAQDGQAAVAAEETALALHVESVRGKQGGFGRFFAGSKERKFQSGARGKRRGGIMEDDAGNGAACKMTRVLGHGPCDLQSAAAIFLPVACVPPTLRRVVAENDQAVCFFMTWSASSSDRWHDEVFFLKVDGFKSEHARWDDAAGSPLNFTWLRAALTPPNCFESVGLHEVTPEEQALASRPKRAVNRNVSLFSKQEEEEEEDNAEDAAALRKIAEAKKQAASKMRMSLSVDAWVLCPFRNICILRRQNMMDAFESQLLNLLGHAGARHSERKKASVNRLPVDTIRTPLLPIEMWAAASVAAPAARKSALKNMTFVYVGPKLPGQHIDDQDDEGDLSDTFVAAEDDFERKGGRLVSRHSVVQSTDGDAAAAAAAAAAAFAAAAAAVDDGVRRLCEPICFEEETKDEAALGDEGVASVGNAHLNASEQKAASSTSQSSSAAATASYLRAGTWARPAQVALSTDASAPLLRSGHTLVSFPVAIPSDSPRAFACRAAAAASDPAQDSHRQSQAQYVSPAVAGIVFGGFDGSAPLEDLWGWSAAANKWFELPNAFIGSGNRIPLARYNHCAASLSPGGMFVCGGVIGAANDMPVRGKEVTMWWDAHEQGWAEVSVSQRYTGCNAFDPELTFATLTGVIDTLDMKRPTLYCPPQLSDCHMLRVREESLFDWTGSLPDTAVLVGGRRFPHQPSEQVMQLMPLSSGWAWLPLPPLPHFGVYSHSACSMNGCVAVWGGCVTATEPAYFEDVNFGQRFRQQDLLLYDVHRGKEWTRVKLGGQVPPLIYGASMLPIGNNQILIFGGSDGSFVLGSDVVWLVDLRNQMSTLLSQRAAADAQVQENDAARLQRLEREQELAVERAQAEAAAAKAKRDRLAARRARGSIILEAHDVLTGGGGRRVEASVSQRMQALGLALADQAGFTHGDVDAASLVDVLMASGESETQQEPRKFIRVKRGEGR